MKKFAFLALSLFVASSFMACHDENEEDTKKDTKYAYEVILNNPTADVMSCCTVEATVVVPGCEAETFDATADLTSKNEWRFRKISDEKAPLTLTVTCKVKDVEALDEDKLYTIQVGASLKASESDVPAGKGKIKSTTMIGQGMQGKVLKARGQLSETTTLEY